MSGTSKSPKKDKKSKTPKKGETVSSPGEAASSKRNKKHSESASAATVKSAIKKAPDVPGQRKAPEKGKKTNKRATDIKKKGKVEKKKKAVKRNKTLYEQIGYFFGYYMGPINLVDPYALEAVQALNLSTWDLRKLKAKFDTIDLDGSGAIDYDEFFEAVGEVRSPFTDKLFALIGK